MRGIKFEETAGHALYPAGKAEDAVPILYELARWLKFTNVDTYCQASENDYEATVKRIKRAR